MPVIRMALGASQISTKQKKEFIEKVTTCASEITGIGAQSFIVFIEQLDENNIGVGGVTLADKIAAAG